MEKRTLYLIISVLVILCIVLFAISLRGTTRYSPDILQITQPATALVGTVQEIDKDRMVISLEDSDRITDETVPTRTPENRVLYTVHFTDNTTAQVRNDAAFSVPGMSEFDNKALLSAIQKNMTVMVKTRNDLRLSQGRDIVADAVMLSTAEHPLFGTIASRENNSLTLDVSGQAVTVDIIPSTDFFAMTTSTLPQTLSLSDLKQGDSISAFILDAYHPDGKNTALRIITMPAVPASPVNSSAPVSDTIPKPALP